VPRWCARQARRFRSGSDGMAPI